MKTGLSVRVLLTVLLFGLQIPAVARPDRFYRNSEPFELEGTVLSSPLIRWKGDCSFIVDAGTNRCVVNAEVRKLKGFVVPSCGDVVHVQGVRYFDSDLWGALYAKGIRCLGRVPIAESSVVDRVERLLDGSSTLQRLRLRGRVIEVVTEDLGGEWLFVILRSGIHTFYACTINREGELPRFRALIDAEVIVSGFAGWHHGDRRFHNPMLSIGGLDDVEVVEPAACDPFDAPPLEEHTDDAPAAFAQLGRRTLSGVVLAACGERDFILRDVSGGVHDVSVAGEESLPPAGGFVKVSGYPQTDLFHVNLAHARVRPETAPRDFVPKDEAPIRSLPGVLYDRQGKRHVDVTVHGRTAVLRGRVRGVYRVGERVDRLMLDCDGEPLGVESVGEGSAFDGIEDDSIVEVRGVLRIDTENWRPDCPLPRIRGIELILRSPDDVTVLRRPPWWTPVRLLAVIGLLLAALGVLWAWNRVLERIVRRRSRALVREELDREKAELRVRERTRLAVELHDSLSQNLTGVAFQIDAAERARKKNPAQVEHHHLIARQALRSCREELKNCLWDLRNLAIDERDAARAVRATLEPCLGAAELEIAFGVDKRRIDDVRFYAILRMLRELATNAVRHGQAKRVRISATEDGTAGLLLTVEDDGCGFDPKDCAGSAEGHYGLEGIRERVASLGGSFEILSEPGSTRAEIRLPL